MNIVQFLLSLGFSFAFFCDPGSHTKKKKFEQFKEIASKIIRKKGQVTQSIKHDILK